MPDHFVWLIWSSAFLAPWLFLYALFPEDRRIMLRASLLTAPFGLTEPIFVPRYWNPPSLFDLAQRTGFDIESLIFSFALGGVGVVLYNILTRGRWTALPSTESTRHRHRFHRLAISTPVIAFPLLYLLGWNPIYPAITAMGLGALATLLCRPDLAKKTCAGGAVFAAYYIAFMLGLTGSAPGYAERVWNLAALSGIAIYGVPLEEILFGFAFGAYWAGIYEHLTWRRVIAPAAKITPPPAPDRDHRPKVPSLDPG